MSSVSFLVILLLLINKSFSQDYLINTSKCKIPDIPPFNDETNKIFQAENYIPCSNLEPLIYLSKYNNSIYLSINKNVEELYTLNGLQCCYYNVNRRGHPNNPDVGIRKSVCVRFKDKVEVTGPYISVKCKDNNDHIVYENTYSAMVTNTKINEKLEKSYNTTPISVLMVVIDSVSRLNLIRTMPKTRNFLLNNNFIEFKGYNKINDNTLPNFMAFLTGYNLTKIHKQCNPQKLNALDECPLIWYDYRKLGYVTAYAEDDAGISTFNYMSRGFTNPPTDYYFKPYIEASEQLRVISYDGMPYCTGPETSGERILNIAKDFAITFKDHPKFGIFWMNTFSHNYINRPSGMDNKLLKFFQDLDNQSVFNDSIVIFISDHGIRFGDIRFTKSGYFEERLPFFLLSLPPWFKDKYPKEYKNMQDNANNKLTNTYDLYMTLQHILKLSNLDYEEKPSSACPKCKSLFKTIPERRSCEDAAIPPEWCTCIGHLITNNDTNSIQTAVNFLLSKVKNILEAKAPGKCAKYTLDRVINAFISEIVDYSKYRYLYLIFETKPKAVFLATIKYRNNIENASVFQLVRYDNFYSTGACVPTSLKKMCYCLL